MRIVLEGSPRTTNGIYATMCRGNFPTRYMTAAGKKLKESYSRQARSQYKGEPMAGEVEMEVRLYFGNRRKNDIDNFNKILYDSLTGIIWADDSQIMKVTTWKLYDKERPRVELTIDKHIKIDE